jgi:glutamate racemase
MKPALNVFAVLAFAALSASRANWTVAQDAPTVAQDTPAAQDTPPAAVSNLMEYAVSSGRSPTDAWSFDRAEYQKDTRQLPIGVFDSGIGGLTVLEAILSLDAHHNDTLAPGADGKPDFVDERFIYLGDQANMPYGNYAAVGKTEFLRELILKDVVFLLGKRYWPSPVATQPVFTKPPVKAIAIGCNTATAYGLEDIQKAFKVWGIPVIVVGVVDAGARGVLEVQQQLDVNQKPSTVAILATVGTCNSGAYPRAIQRTLGQAGRRIPSIVQQGFADLAAAIEGDPKIAGAKSIDDIIRQDLHQLLDNYRLSGGMHPIGSIVLGCTHFPLVQDKIVAALKELRDKRVGGQQPYAALIADTIEVVDPAELTAKELFRSLAKARLRANSRADLAADHPEDSFFISVPNSHCREVQLSEDGGLTTDYKYGRESGRLDVEDTIVVPMRISQLPGNSLHLIRGSLPNVWQKLSSSDGAQ